MKNTLLILCMVAGTAYGQLVFKWQAGSLKPGGISSWADLVAITRHMFSPWMLSAFAAMFAGTVCWMLALQTTPLTKAYMFVGLIFAIVMLGGAVVFNEHISAARILGCCLIVAGVIVGGRG
jgi:drug/metabolite transporter (DMT)-like permease